MNSDKELTKQRDAGIDLIKTVAILCTITIHTASAGFYRPLLSFDWNAAVFWASLSRAAVPLFFMCSGALMLDPEKKLSIRKLYTKNVLKLVLAMLFWSMGYKILRLAFDGGLDPASVYHAFKEVLLFNQEFHMYYIHIMLIVYAFLPVTRVFVKNASEKELLYALSLWFVLGIVYPTVKGFWPFSLLTGIPVQWMISMTYASVGYTVLGYCLVRFPLKKRTNALLILSGVALTFGLTVIASSQKGTSYTGFLEAMTVGPALFSAGLFGMLYGSKDRMSGKKAAFCEKVSTASFGIYLIHVFFILLLDRAGLSANSFSCIISVPLISILIFAISYLFRSVLSRIPFFGRWLI